MTPSRVVDLSLIGMILCLRQELNIAIPRDEAVAYGEVVEADISNVSGLSEARFCVCDKSST